MTTNVLPTFADNPGFWDAQAKQPIAGLLVRLADDNRCPLCRYREPDGWLERHPGELVPLDRMLARFTAHLRSTHGMAEDEVLDAVNMGSWR